MRGYKMIVCEVCGQVAEVPAKRKIDYCNKATCEKQAKEAHRAETRRKSNEKIKNKMAEIKASYDGVRTYRDDEIVYVKNIVPEPDKFTIDVLDFAKRLGTLRYEGEQLKNKLRAEQSKSDLADNEFLHEIESVQKLTAGEAINMIIKGGKLRSTRRDVKQLYMIMQTLLGGIIQNPHEYATKSIKSGIKSDVAYAMKSIENKGVQNEQTRT